MDFRKQESDVKEYLKNMNTHAGPYSTLEVPILPRGDVLPLYEDYVLPFYLKSLRNFSAAEEEAFERIRPSITDQLITKLLSDLNWRSRTAATYFALILDRKSHIDHVGKLLLRSDVCFVGAAYCRYLAHFRTSEAIDFLNRYLSYYLIRTDLHFNQHDAAAALRYIDGLTGSNHEQSHVKALAEMAQVRPELMKFVTVDRFTADLDAAARLRHQMLPIDEAKTIRGRATDDE